jgi:hypothetical protein
MPRRCPDVRPCVIIPSHLFLADPSKIVTCRGVITSRNGGCGALDLVGSFTDFVGFSKNGVSSVDFPSTFPLSYRFVHETIKYSHCSDLRDYALAFNVLVTVILSLLLRPTALVVSDDEVHS